jgi:hypothetical protein
VVVVVGVPPSLPDPPSLPSSDETVVASVASPLEGKLPLPELPLPLELPPSVPESAPPWSSLPDPPVTVVEPVPALEPLDPPSGPEPS